MRITIVLPGLSRRLPIGGLRVHYEYANRLARRGHDVVLVHPFRISSRGLRDSAAAAAWKVVRARIRPKPVEWFRFDPGVDVTLVPDLSPRLLPSADVLVATAWQTAAALSGASSRCGEKFQIVYDYEHWCLGTERDRSAMRRAFSGPYTRVATSGAVAAMLTSMGTTYEGVVECGLDHETFQVRVPPEARSREVVGFPGRVEASKGTRDAAAAIGIASEANQPIQAKAFGDPASRPSVGTAVLTPLPSDDELTDFYNSVSVFVLPSWYEGWGLPAIEAMACGAAVVSTRNGGCEDFAVDGETALLVPPREPSLLAAAILRLVEDDELRVNIARRGIDKARTYTWKRAVERLESIFATGSAER